VPCPDDRKWDVIAAVAAELREQYPSSELDGIRVTFPDGWALVRASNTGPNLTMRFEAKTQEGLDRIERVMREALGKHVEVPETFSAGH
jgi:phosphomannomutase/phosphoglucomutase